MVNIRFGLVVASIRNSRIGEGDFILYTFFLITHIAVFCLSYGNIGINYSQNRTPIIVKIVLPAENQLLYLT